MARESIGGNGGVQALLLKLLGIVCTLLCGLVLFFLSAQQMALKEVRAENADLRERVTRLEGLLRAPMPIR